MFFRLLISLSCAQAAQTKGLWRPQRASEAVVAAGLLLLPGIASAKQEGIPQFDIARVCREAKTRAAGDRDLAYRGCVNDEKEARDQLARKWAQFKREDRNDCVAQGAAPLPSYVELLTCLEMSQDARALLTPGAAGKDETAPTPDTRSVPQTGAQPGETAPQVELPPPAGSKP
jgi:hypothetical protein